MASPLFHIVAEYVKLQEGDCWIGLNFNDFLDTVDATLAMQAASPDTNTIWQLVNHLIYWRKVTCNRLRGNARLPDMEDMLLPGETTEAAWKKTRTVFTEVYDELIGHIQDFDSAILDEASPNPSQTYYELLMGCLQHDGYHLGQMVLICKMLKSTQD
jgi:uncharacterized damage-inducible protein DinB